MTEASLHRKSRYLPGSGHCLIDQSWGLWILDWGWAQVQAGWVDGTCMGNGTEAGPNGCVQGMLRAEGVQI